MLTVLFAAPAISSPLSRRLLQVASLTLGGAMLLAGCFAVGKYLGLAPLSYQEMIRFHGIANAIYAIGSLLGWLLADSSTAGRRPGSLSA